MWPGAMRYAVKHAVAATVVVCSIVAFTVISYFGLLAWAVVAGAPIGGPLALPFMLILAVALSIIAALAVLWPVTTLSEVVCRRFGHWQTLIQIPMATFLLFVEVIAIEVLIALLRQQPGARGLVPGAIAGVILLVPLGIYWWSLQATNKILEMSGALWRWLRKRSSGLDAERPG